MHSLSNSHCLPLFTHAHRHTHRPVAHLMSDGESNRQPWIFIDVAAAVWLTHPREMGQTQSLTGLVHSSTDVFPGDHKQITYVHIIFPPLNECNYTKLNKLSGEMVARGRVRATCLVTNTATSWWAGWVSLCGLRFFCQAQKLDKVVSAWWTIFNPFCNKQLN